MPGREIYTPVAATAEILQWRVKNEGLDDSTASRISSAFPMLQSASGFKTNWEIQMAIAQERQTALENEAKTKLEGADAEAKKAEDDAKAAVMNATGAGTARRAKQFYEKPEQPDRLSLGGALPYGPVGGGRNTILGY